MNAGGGAPALPVPGATVPVHWQPEPFRVLLVFCYHNEPTLPPLY